MALKGKKAEAKTRLLLALWELGAIAAEIRKGDLTKKIVKKGEKSGDYQELFDELSETEAITVPARNKIAINLERVRDLLSVALQDEDFEFKAQVGRSTANALLRLIREVAKVRVSTSATLAEKATEIISSYEEFKLVALEVYNTLNRDFNLDNLVPIYRIRRKIGDRVSRSEFDQWLLEMQMQDVWQLIGGEMPELTPDKAEDSIRTSLGGVRYYAKKL